MIEYTLTAEVDDEYAARERQLRKAIGDQHMLREAQQSGSSTALLFQNRIDCLTQELLRLQEKVSDLRELDKGISRAGRVADRAQFNVARIKISRMVVAGLTAVIGLLFLVVAVAAWGLVAAVAGLTLLAAGGGTLALMARSRRLATDDWDDALDRLAMLRECKQALLDRSGGENQSRTVLALAPPPGSEDGVFASVVRSRPNRNETTDVTENETAPMDEILAAETA